jgi:hypothetical protein
MGGSNLNVKNGTDTSRFWWVKSLGSFLLLQWAYCSPGVYGAMVDALCACHSFILDEFQESSDCTQKCKSTTHAYLSHLANFEIVQAYI